MNSASPRHNLGDVTRSGLAHLSPAAPVSSLSDRNRDRGPIRDAHGVEHSDRLPDLGPVLNALRDCIAVTFTNSGCYVSFVYDGDPVRGGDFGVLGGGAVPHAGARGAVPGRDSRGAAAPSGLIA